MIRDKIIEDVAKEVCGPDPHPEYLDLTTNQEVLLERVHGSPKSRYGAGMLYPQSTGINEIDDENEIIEAESNEDDAELDLENSRASLADDSSSDEAIGLANEYLPSALGFTIRISADCSDADIHIKSSWYERLSQTVREKIVRYPNGEIVEKVNPITQVEVERGAWIRRPIDISPIKINPSKFHSNLGQVYEENIVLTPWNEAPWLSIQIYNRSTEEDLREGIMTLTFSMINMQSSSGNHQIDDRAILFQNKLRLEVSDGQILPYKERIAPNDTEQEESLRLLYRDKRSFGIGHGCSVVWGDTEYVKEISSSIIPVFEIPPVNPTVDVELSMLQLSDEGDWGLGLNSLDELKNEYTQWINDLENEINTLEQRYRDAGYRNLEKCKDNLSRIEHGIQLLKSAGEGSDIVQCFRWMNKAMLWQQQRAKTPQRLWKRNGRWTNATYDLEPLSGHLSRHENLIDFHSDRRKGRWRPFQLAFVLMNLECIWNPSSDERDIVDLIWFPTGGGKTEAYLGLAAFTIFARRIRGKDFVSIENHSGTTILMRYTLRLLTTQQYERASSLICGCELIRQNNIELGIDPISIGLWVGSGSTPNTRQSANALYQNLSGSNFRNTEYNLIVMKCPCCGAQIGKLNEPSNNKKIVGIERRDGTGNRARIVFVCENHECEFTGVELPLYVVDQEIYEICPTLVLGTVDKFAMVSWKQETGALFGFRRGDEKSRITPPELIIQDELHLISGPLGTIVGLYEAMIQTLCSNYGLNSMPFFSSEQGISAKIIASSATISRAEEQVKALYSTDQVNIFPPQGLKFGDTWFSKEETPTESSPGRKYCGVLAPGYRSGQTTVVRLYSSILQSVMSSNYSSEVKNYYWTLLGYFNSIRELGMASSLIYADIKDYLVTLQNRKLIPYEERRRLRLFKELTSRISSSEIPDSLKELEKNYDGSFGSALDACVATNMIATGVDISRLGLMLIHGQPKTTAEYIQASSRVGRDSDGPGLVLMLYSPSKPRDKSQYEHFQSFHSRIYSHVEPTSVTPFSINSRERVLHAVLIGLVRHFSNSSLQSSPNLVNQTGEFQQLCSWIREIISKRCLIIDPEEHDSTMELFDRRVSFWQNGFEYYGDAGNFGILTNNYVPLMYARGSEITEEIREGNLSLPTLTSMRGVDEEGKIDIFIP